MSQKGLYGLIFVTVCLFVLVFVLRSYRPPSSTPGRVEQMTLGQMRATVDLRSDAFADERSAPMCVVDRGAQVEIEGLRPTDDGDWLLVRTLARKADECRGWTQFDNVKFLLN